MDSQQRSEVYKALVDLRKRIAILELNAAKTKKQQLLEHETSINTVKVQRMLEKIRQNTLKISFLKSRVESLEMSLRNKTKAR